MRSCLEDNASSEQVAERFLWLVNGVTSVGEALLNLKRSRAPEQEGQEEQREGEGDKSQSCQQVSIREDLGSQGHSFWKGRRLGHERCMDEDIGRRCQLSAVEGPAEPAASRVLGRGGGPCCSPC